MKKTVIKPDGTEEVIEGTPEEIAELEKRLKQVPVNEDNKGNRRILNEEEIRRLFAEEIEHHKSTDPHCYPRQPEQKPLKPYWEPFVIL